MSRHDWWSKGVITMESDERKAGSVFSGNNQEITDRNRLDNAIKETEGNQQCHYCNFKMECGQHDCVWQEVGA